MFFSVRRSRPASQESQPGRCRQNQPIWRVPSGVSSIHRPKTDFPPRRIDTRMTYGLSRTVVRFERMRARRSFPIAPGKKLSALLCLLTVFLLWSPVWAAAWQAAGMSCCSGGMCPAHNHSNRPQPVPCDHHSSDRLSQCSLSCCQSESRNFVTSYVFLLQSSLQLSRTPHFVGAPTASGEKEMLLAVGPPDQPPRPVLS
jgi:hypothetical protein